MPSTRELRRRIRSVDNTAQVTKAMQFIAASKMRRAQQMVLAGRPYSQRIQAVLADLVQTITSQDDELNIPLLDDRQVNRTSLLLITPDRGLCGALVGNIQRAAGEAIQKSESPVEVIAVGRKGENFVVRTGQILKASFSVGDRPTLDETVGISRMLMDEFENADADRVLIAYSEFVNIGVQRPVVKRLLPVEPPSDAPSGGPSDTSGFIYEPTPREVLLELVPRYVETLVYHTILEAIASEHSARMVAMQNATDNALELVDDLTLELNKARQEMITSELLDIIGGVAAVEA
jgi:F-type H+-transporting ATPase subunit gamma